MDATGRLSLTEYFPEIFNYKVDREAPLPSGESIEKIVEEQ
jgi:hypothetical protein